MDRIKNFSWLNSNGSAEPRGPVPQDRAPLLDNSFARLWRPDTAETGSHTVSESNEAFLALSRWERFIAFLLCIGGAAACFLISFLTIPLLVIKPRKFAVSFTMGSFLFMLGFAILQGPLTQLYHLIAPERLPFTVIYLVSMALTVYFALGRQSYIATVVCSVIQIAALLAYLLAYFPGGISTLRLGGRIALRGATNLLPV